MRLIYLAAPLSAPDLATRCDRMADAQALRCLIEEDPLCMVYLPHERIARRFGHPNDEETAEARADSMRLCLAAVSRIAKMNGALHVLTLPDGTLSRGCQAEYDQWIAAGGSLPILWLKASDGSYGVIS